MANYHPGEEMLTAFSAGNLQLSHALCVSTHIEQCDECRTNLLRLNSLGASLLSDLEPAKASDGLKSNVMAQLDMQDSQPEEQLVSTDSQVNPNIPRALRQFISRDYDDLEWKNISTAIQSVSLCTDINGSKVELMKIGPGGAVPTHTHTGDEYTLLLEGSFSDEEGIYKKGDFLVRDGRHKHKPVVSKDQECICLAVTDAPIEFTGFFTRLLNPFIRRGY